MLSNSLVIVVLVVSLVCLGASLFALFNLSRNYVTRREYDDERSDTKAFKAKIEEMFTRTFEKIDERDASMSVKIETVAKNAYDGRTKIHERVNDLRERTAKNEMAAETCPRPPHCDSNNH